MATKRQKKKAYNTAKKVAKNNPTLFIVIAILVVIALVGVGVYLYFSGAFGNNKKKNAFIVNGDVQIYSIEMHDKYGDSLFVKYGDYDILIDAGDRGDGQYVQEFVDSHISSDKILDLLVVTHCHSDHMGGLTKMSSIDNDKKALDNVSKVNNIIDFGHMRVSNYMYDSYAILRESFIDNGAKYYSAYEAVHGLDGLSNVLTFGDLSVEIIDTNYYASKTTDLGSQDDVPFNEYSVATLIKYKKTKLFCAGDLEDNGEKELIANASNTSLKDIKDSDTVIYKACHHGTDVGTANNKTSGATSSNGGNRMALLKIIKPDFCLISSTINESDHPFPRALATMLYFTEEIYFNGTNGTLCFDLNGEDVGVQGLGATTKYKIDDKTIDYDKEKNKKYIETEWYKKHIFNGAKSWYNGSIEKPTDKELTEWYLEKLRKDYQ